MLHLFHYPDFDFYDPSVGISNLRKCSPRQVNNSPFGKWTPVIDSNRN